MKNKQFHTKLYNQLATSRNDSTTPMQNDTICHDYARYMRPCLAGLIYNKALDDNKVTLMLVRINLSFHSGY
jgi:hypothetical protein